jgi:regulator of sigma E protease
MNLFDWLTGLGGSAAGYILPFLFVLTIVVFFHELGHFLVARWCGVAVKVFSIGFGPEIFGFNDRKGTRWRLSIVPLGGYVRFLGDDNEVSRTNRDALAQMSPEDKRRTFAGQNVAKRAAIVAAGPIANFILAIAIFTAIFSVFGREVMTARIDSVVEGSAAATAGLQPGDVVKSINGAPVSDFSDLQRTISVSSGDALTIVVDRSGSDVTLSATPERKIVTDRFGNEQRLGVLGITRNTPAGDITTEHYSVPQALALATEETWFVVDRTLGYLVQVVAGREPPDQLGGPIRVAEVSAQVATLGIVALINLAAILSISIGLINLFPIPMLDGGHLLFFAVEAIRGRPLSERAQEIGFRIGFAAVLALMIFATGNDISSIWHRISGAG